MTAKTTAQRVTEVIAYHVGVRPDQIKPAARFIEDLGLDEFDRIEMLLSLETELAIEISDATIETAQTVAGLIAAAEHLVAAQGEAA